MYPRGCERQAVFQGHVLPLRDLELQQRKGDAVEAVMPVRLGNAALRKQRQRHSLQRVGCQAIAVQERVRSLSRF